MAQRYESIPRALALHAAIMEAYYGPDKPPRISFIVRKFGMDKSAVRTVLKKYYPKTTNRDIRMIIGSKFNNDSDMRKA